MSATQAEAKFGQTLALESSLSGKKASNRRSGTSEVVEAAATAQISETPCDVVRNACREVLKSWPGAKAAILFGSRARGDHCEDSDWDIAFITDDEQLLPDTVHRCLKKLERSRKIVVQGLAISQAQFCEGADSLGNIAVPIAREGLLIAGDCRWPETDSAPIFKPDEYMDWRSGALSRVATATTHLAMAIDNARRGKDRNEIKRFVADSSDAAEYCVKIAFGKLASGTRFSIPRRHQVDEIVEILDGILEQNPGPNATWWQSDDGRKFRFLLHSMNGGGNEDHQFGYAGLPPVAKVISRAANRLVATVSFAILEVEELPGPSGLQSAAREVAASQWAPVLRSARRLRQSMQSLGSNDLTFAAAGSALAESVSVAVDFGEEIAQELETLAGKLFVEMEAESRAAVNPVFYVVGFRTDGRPLAIADNLEAIMDRADGVSGSRQPRVGAGLELAQFAGFKDALSTLGFAREPSPRLLSESEAIKLVENQEEIDSGESKIRTTLAKLVRERRVG